MEWILFIYLFILSFVLLGPHPRHRRFPSSESNRGYSCQSTLQPQQYQIWAMSGNTGSLMHWVRPEIKPVSSWILVGFVNHWARKGTPRFLDFLRHHHNHHYHKACFQHHYMWFLSYKTSDLIIVSCYNSVICHMATIFFKLRKL